MSYKGFTIIHTPSGWIVVVDYFTRWMAFSESDAKAQVDEFLNNKKKK
jgi:hypothetical protein